MGNTTEAGGSLVPSSDASKRGGEEGRLQALSGYLQGTRQAEAATDSGVVGAIAKVGNASSVEQLRELKQDEESLPKRIEELETKLRAARNQLDQTRQSIDQIDELGMTKENARLLASLVYEVEQSVTLARGYLDGTTGGGGYYADFFEQVVIPALEGRGDDVKEANIWNDKTKGSADTQVGQRVTNGDAFTALRARISGEDIVALVRAVCSKSQLELEEAKSLVQRLKEKEQE